MRHPHPDEIVSVTLPPMLSGRQDHILFHVVTTIDSVIALDPVLQGDTRSVPSPVRDCFLTLEEEDRPMGIKGYLYERSPGDWRFKVRDSITFQSVQTRLRLCAPISVAPAEIEDDAQARELQTVNIGVAGVLVQASDGISLPETVRITLSLPGEDDPIEAVAELAARQGDLRDYRYTIIEPEARGRLAAFIIADQRAALRRRRSRERLAGGGLDDDLDF